MNHLKSIPNKPKRFIYMSLLFSFFHKLASSLVYDFILVIALFRIIQDKKAARETPNVDFRLSNTSHNTTYFLMHSFSILSS